jgi:hypothetical protein
MNESNANSFPGLLRAFVSSWPIILHGFSMITDSILPVLPSDLNE